MLLQRACDIRITPIDWLWPGYLAVGSLAILDGDPGQGKSLLTLDLAARLTTGRPWPDGQPCPAPASVLLLCTEDLESAVAARLQALNADLARVYLWPRAVDPPRLPADIPRLEAELQECRAKLLIIDPIVAFLDHNVQTASDASVRRALQPLAHLAEKHQCAILLVRHLNKGSGANVLYRGGGSIAFVAACRSAWLVGSDPRNDACHVLAQAKNNYAPIQPSLAYQLPKDSLSIAWEGAVEWSANELTSRHLRPARRRARELLTKLLTDGPCLASEVKNAARKAGLSKRTIERAKAELEIRTERIENDGKRCDLCLLPHQQAPLQPSATPVLDAWLKKWHELYPPKDADEET